MQTARPPEELRLTSRQRMSAAKKRDWRERMSPAAKAAAMGGLKKGWERKVARHAEERQEWAWDAIRLYLQGNNRRQIIQQCPKATLKTLATVFRDVGLPLSRKGLYDRGNLFTRRDGSTLQKALGYTTSEFATKIGERKRLPAIWLSAQAKALNPPVAKKCVALRNEIANVLLTRDTRTVGNKFDQYNRKEVVLSLYPNLRGEYKELLATISEFRNLLIKSEPPVPHCRIASFVFQQARAKSAQRGDFRFMLCWLPELMPHILQLEPGVWSKLPRLIAHEILGRTSSCPPSIIEDALEPDVQGCPSGRDAQDY